MIEPAELFAQLTAQIEDVHGIAVDGQSAQLSDDERVAIAVQACAGLQRASAIVTKIRLALEATS